MEVVEKPAIAQPHDVLIRVLAVGLDGTDREILQDKYGTSPEGDDHLIFGHEVLGVVEKVGAEGMYKPGDLITATVRRPCKDTTCVNCRNGHTDFCETGNYAERGIKGAHGYLAEYVVEDDRYLIQVPKACLAYGMLAEPQSIVEKVWDQVQRMQQRLIWEPRTALILGSGPLGLLAAVTCRVLNLNVYVWSIDAEDSLQAQLVKECGAVYVQAVKRGGKDGQGDGEADKRGEGNKEGAGVHRTLSGFVEQLNVRIDFIMECTGFSPLAFEAMSVLGPNGVLALLGVTPGNRKLEISADVLNHSMVLENKCIFGSVNASRKDFETGLYRLQQIEEQYPVFLLKLLTNRLTLEQVPGMDFSKLGIKAVVDIVPAEQWDKLVMQSSEVKYSFSV